MKEGLIVLSFVFLYDHTGNFWTQRRCVKSKECASCTSGMIFHVKLIQFKRRKFSTIKFLTCLMVCLHQPILLKLSLYIDSLQWYLVTLSNLGVSSNAIGSLSQIVMSLWWTITSHWLFIDGFQHVQKSLLMSARNGCTWFPTQRVILPSLYSSSLHVLQHSCPLSFAALLSTPLQTLSAF